jgi:hypothetical protein
MADRILTVNLSKTKSYFYTKDLNKLEETLSKVDSLLEFLLLCDLNVVPKAILYSQIWVASDLIKSMLK